MDPDRRRRSRILSFLLLLMILLGLPSVVGFSFSRPVPEGSLDVDLIVSLLAVVAVVVAYLLNRLGFFFVATTVVLVATSIAVYVTAIPTHHPDELQVLYYQLIPLVLAGVFLPPVGVLSLAAASIGGIIAFLVVLPQELGQQVPLLPIAIVSAFVVGGAAFRNHLEKQRLATLSHMATHDMLTGLPNRILLEETLSSALHSARRRGTGAALLHMDIDGFKQINDAYGPATGDGVLFEVAKRVEMSLRATDVVARREGDEFAIVLPELNNPSAPVTVIDKVRSALAEPVRLGETEVVLSAAFGVALFPDAGEDSEALETAAATALRHAKSIGPNSYSVFTEALSEDAKRALDLAAELRGALARGEMTLHYQPLVRPTDRRVVAVEALLRWTNRRFGVVGPDEFIPLAEACGLIESLGDWVAGEAAHAAEQLAASSSEPPTVGVNVSERQLRLSNLAERLARGAGVYLELSEAIVFRGGGTLELAIEDLAKAGVSLSIDDFGAGFSTLRNLAHLPVGQIKIDRSFTGRIDHDNRELAVVTNLIQMSKDLGLQTVAEGVETERQKDLYLKMGIDLIQGWYYAKAMPLEEIMRLPRSDEPDAGYFV